MRPPGNVPAEVNRSSPFQKSRYLCRRHINHKHATQHKERKTG